MSINYVFHQRDGYSALTVPPESGGKEPRSFRAAFVEHCQISLSEDET